MVQTDDETLSEPMTFQMRLPHRVKMRLVEESRRTMISMNQLVRRCVLAEYEEPDGESFVAHDSTKSTVTVGNIQTDGGSSNG